MSNKKQSSININSLLRIFPGHLYCKDLDGTYLFSNESFSTTLNLNHPDEIVGKNDYDFLEKSNADEIRRIDNEVIQTGELKTIEEFAILPDGKESFYLSTKQPLKDKQGNIIGLIGTSINDTTRVKAYLAAKNQKEDIEKKAKLNDIYLNNILNHLPEKFYWLDTEGRILGCNNEQAKLFGLTKENVIGHNIFEINELIGLPSSIAEAIRENDQQVMDSGIAQRKEEIYIQEDVEKTFLSYKNPLYDSDKKIIGIFGVSIDISERKKMEQALLRSKEKAEAASKAKSEFLMNISHDLRSPFSGIIGLTEMLHKQENDPEKKQLISHILNSSRSLLSVLNDVIDITNVEINPKHKNEAFSLKKSIKTVIHAMQPAAYKNNLELHCNIADHVSDMLIGDKKALERILINLIGNALKFTDSGHVSLQVKNSGEQQNNKNIIEFIVEDTGIGIPCDKLDIIFEQFTRLTPAHQNKYQGRGLGLWIVKQFLDSINGSVKVQSELGKGTRFQLYIPFDTAKQQQPNKQKQNKSLKKPANLSLNKILVVEDDGIAQTIARLLLKEYFECDIDIASSGSAAFSACENNKYDLILLDLGLPDMNGFEVAKLIRTHTNQNQQTIIYGLTAHILRDEIKSHHNYFNEMLLKPLSYELCDDIAQTMLFSSELTEDLGETVGN